MSQLRTAEWATHSTLTVLSGMKLLYSLFFFLHDLIKFLVIHGGVSSLPLTFGFLAGQFLLYKRIIVPINSLKDSLQSSQSYTTLQFI